MDQRHLNYVERINLWSYYTDDKYIKIIEKMLKKHISKDWAILDSSCGYGNFFEIFNENLRIGNDIDDVALSVAKKRFPDVKFYNDNALKEIDRKKFGIRESQKLCIVWNPPYNDTTSIIRNSIKSGNVVMDTDIQTRDLGISFLLSYNKLNADCICVLHPLSYLIKRSNFKLLSNFSKNYKLIDGLIINSGTFSDNSKSIQFPILIGLYRKTLWWMDYNYIKNYCFKEEWWQSFALKDFDFIDNYISKYPNKYNISTSSNNILFYTMRDINALKRNKTFLKEYQNNAIIVDKNKLDYYVYVDSFKQWSNEIPYFLWNLTVFIDNQNFMKNKKYFIIDCISRNSFLKWYYKDLQITTNDIKKSKEKLNQYFYSLLQQYVS